MASEGKCFNILWNLENVSYCPQKTGEEIFSPAFVVDTLDGTKWKLCLYPRGDGDGKDLSCYLIREADSKGAEKIEIKFELALKAEDGSEMKLGEDKKIFLKGGAGFGWRGTMKRKEVFEAKRAAFLPEDTLSVRCRMWKSVGEMTEDIRCIAQTRIGVEKRSLVWNVKNFRKLESGNKCTYLVKSVKNDVPVMSVDLSLTGELGSEEILLKLSLQDQTIKFSTLTLFLITSSGIRVECNQEDIWFDNPTRSKQITFFYTKKLLEEENMYLPNDTLSLVWEWAFSRGEISTESEEDRYGCVYSEVKISDALTNKIDRTTLLTVLADNAKSAYDEHFLSDVNLKTKTSVFPAHNFVLGASSSVFKAMFSSDMKERNGDCINIEDLSDDTVNRMLLFVYTTRVEDLKWEGASHLYVAADKYDLSSLKNICSSFLKDNLTPRNACEILLLSDLHADDDLKSAVQDYILKNGKQMINSDEWKRFLQTNAQLAAETLSLLFK